MSSEIKQCQQPSIHGLNTGASQYASPGKHVLSQKSDYAFSAKANGLVANADVSDNKLSASLQYKALSADIVEMAVVLVSPSVEDNITKAKSEAARAYASKIEDLETKLETRSVQRNASFHSSVGIPASQKYGGAGTSQVSLFLHFV